MDHLMGRRVLTASVVALLLTAVPSADHWWGGYHWVTTGGAVPLDLGDNVDSRWDVYLDGAAGDWNRSTVLSLTVGEGATTAKRCSPIEGRIEVCNYRYGGRWLGLAQIWVSGGHIVQAVAKLNDRYFDTATYNTPEWRRLVMCQEIAHGFGLDHQDETFNNANLGSCMDYTNDPDGGEGGAVDNDPSNEGPNQHDYDLLGVIYDGHDVSGGGGKPAWTGGRGASGDNPSEWGRLVRQNGDRRIQVFELDLGNGNKVLTHVYWADPERDARGNRQ